MISVVARAREIAEAEGAKDHPRRGEVRPEHVAQATDEALAELRAALRPRDLPPDVEDTAEPLL